MIPEMLSNIHFVLSHTSHPGNIGAAARALKTMGLNNLILVKPKLFPHPDAIAMSAGADDILTQAKITHSLEEAIADCQLILGTSGRERSLAWSLIDARTAAEKVMAIANKQKVAILFGCEQSGLTNEELQCCHYHVQIPANPLYNSLNIAAAVQVIAYEIRMAFLGVGLPLLNPLLQNRAGEEGNNFISISQNSVEGEEGEIMNQSPIAPAQQLELFYQKLEKILFDIEFIKPKQPNRIMQRLRRLFQRAQVEAVEMHILLGILNELVKKLKGKQSNE
jgi:tRNA (cytidine32/uridine32-2'-O)-methyltransferase